MNTHDNEADLLTKLLPSGEKRRGFVRRLLHHVFGIGDVLPAAAAAASVVGMALRRLGY